MKEHYLRMKMPESQGVPLLSNLESQFRFTIKYNRMYTCVSGVRKGLERKGESERICDPAKKKEGIKRRKRNVVNTSASSSYKMNYQLFS